jgi:hypothetical protein
VRDSAATSHRCAHQGRRTDRMKGFRATIVVTGLVASIAVVGVFASGALAAPAPSFVTNTATDVWRFNTESVALEPAGNARSESVVYVRLPAGDWVLSMDLTAVTLGNAPEIVRCGLYKDNHLVSIQATSVGPGLGPLAQNISTTGVVQSTTSFAANIKCQHDHDRVGDNVPYIDPGATIWAHKAANYQ